MRQVLQSVTILLQSATGITKCDDYYKVRQYNVPVIMCNMSAVVKPYFIEIVNFSQKTGNDQTVLIFWFSLQCECYDQNCIITKANYIYY